MKPGKFTIHALLAFLFLVSIRGSGQHNGPSGLTEENMAQAARDIMTSAVTCNLITIDREGGPRSRMMDAFPPEDDFTVWFGTNPQSRKVEQIRNNPRVNLYYQAPDHSGYVTINGRAQLVDDPGEKASRWKEAWAAFYPHYPDDYLLIRVVPERMEVVSYSHGLVGDTITWEPPSIIFESTE